MYPMNIKLDVLYFFISGLKIVKMGIICVNFGVFEQVEKMRLQLLS